MSETRFRPYGVVRQMTRLSPRTGASAGTVMFERDARERVDRLRAAVADRLRERMRPTRPRMRGLVVSGAGRLGWRDLPVPVDPGSLGAMVRPIAIATCDVDRPVVLGYTPFPRPFHLGHECVAEVVSVGDEVTDVRPGDRVVVPFEINCGDCAPCRSGLTGNCLAVPPLSMYGLGLVGGYWGGALADLLAVPFADAMLVRLPTEIEPVAAASVADTVCDGYRHIGPHLPALLERDPDADVLIISALKPRCPYSASTTLYAGQVALALGARRVAYVDVRDHVREHAERLGMEPLRPADLRRRRPAALVVELSTIPKGLSVAVAKTAPDGVCSSAGTMHHSARIPVGKAFGRNVTVHIGRAHTRALIPAVLELMVSGALRPQDVTTAVAALDEAPVALNDHMRGDTTKTILTA